MPTYEYVCEKCDHEFELFQSITVDALETCPRDVCPRKRWAKGKVRRAIGTGAGIIFKGSGFYETDYRSDSYKKGAQSEKKSSGDDSASSGDSKPKKDNGKSSTNDSSSSGKKKSTT